ncbi:MAG: 6,7-dimethyl-8-ribityllumazine synthase [Candidatus Diapherotrites archaeon]|nr:6,7-dimethyl-8-ribityllumazine synthase [Candidatus Diapherotrites archaeon]
MNLGIIVSEFNYDITSKMLERAKAHANFLGVNVSEVVWVPGAFDMPLAMKKLAEKSDVDAIALLGAVIKGDTDHDQIVAQHAARKAADLSIEFNKPIALGIIGPNVTRAAAMERIDEYAKRAVEAAVKMAKV